MSKFAETIYRLMAEHEPPLRQSDVAKRAGLSASHFSLILTGKQKIVYSSDVPGLAKALSSNPHKQAELIYAYLLDHVPPMPASKHVRVTLDTAKRRGDALDPPNRIKLAPEVEAALEKIAARIPDDKDMREMILRLAKYS
jgi:hypothetical protein